MYNAYSDLLTSLLYLCISLILTFASLGKYSVLISLLIAFIAFGIFSSSQYKGRKGTKG